MRMSKNNIRIACIGFENQTEPDADMPLRVYSYDGAEYKAQLLKKNLEDYRIMLKAYQQEQEK